MQFGLNYGVANRHGQVSHDETKAILEYASKNGIDTLDTAISYGESEERLGKMGVSNWRVVSKLASVPKNVTDVAGWVRDSVDGSLERLKISSLDGLLLHRSQDLLCSFGEELHLALVALKEQGKVGKIGVSIYGPEELDVIWPRYKFDLVQSPFNLVDHRLNTSGWLKRLKDEGVEVHTRSAFLQGLLLMPQPLIPPKFAPWAGLWRNWHDWLSNNAVPAVHACLAFPLSFPEIDRVIVGVDNVSQLEQIVEASLDPVPGHLPDLRCEDENLVNPARWSQL